MENNDSKRSQKELVEAITRQEGYRFNDFTLTSEGPYAVSDADWNYKDVPHLKHIHQLVEGYPTVIADDYIAAIFVQKVFGFKMPISVFNYQSAPNQQTYYTTLAFFVLIIETSYERIDECFTRVHTKYCIGSKPFWQFLFPLMKLAITRNYRDLMSGDTPMRMRRGLLRSWGYRFKGDGKSYSFKETRLIQQVNVINPTNEVLPQSHDIQLPQSFDTDSIVEFGRSDRFGLTLEKKQNELLLFNRLCTHEGAELSGKSCEKGTRMCPWHGRRFPPVLKIDLNRQKSGEWRLPNHVIHLDGDRLRIQPMVAGATKISFADSAVEVKEVKS